MPRPKSTDPSKSPRSETVVPIAEERLVVGRIVSEGAGVRIHKHVAEHTVPVAISLLDETVEIERVRIDREVDRPQPIREEGSVLIIPLHEEVTVLKKKLVLKEELRILRRRHERTERTEQQLRSERADVEALPPEEKP